MENQFYMPKKSEKTRPADRFLTMCGVNCGRLVDTIYTGTRNLTHREFEEKQGWSI